MLSPSSAEQVAIGVAEHGGVVAERRDARDVVGQVEGRAGAGRAVGAQEDDRSRGLVDEGGVAVREHRGDGWALALEDRLDAVERIEREQLFAIESADGHRRLVDDEGTAVNGVDRDVVTIDAHAARLAEAHGAIVDELDQALRAVVDDDDVAGLVDVVVRTRVGGADRCRHLADDAVDVPDVADVALEQPGAAVVGLGVRPLPAIGEQRGDDDRGDDRGEHGEHAAGDAPARRRRVTARPARSSLVTRTASPLEPDRQLHR